MAVSYDKYYQKENLFGEAYPELVQFFANYPKRGRVLDLGCGQGRDAISIARLGYDVLGLDVSKVGIKQVNSTSKKEQLNLLGQVVDIYTFDKFDAFDFILLDSMFHFETKDKQKEVGLIKKIISTIKKGCLVIFCIKDSGNKVKILNEAIGFKGQLKLIADTKFKYIFEDDEIGHRSVSDYRMIIVEK